MGAPAEDGTPGSSREGDIDAPAWQRLIDSANSASLLVVIESRLGPALRARLEPDDILQESLMQAWRDRGAARFETPRAFRAWLLTIIDHRIRDAAEHGAAKKRGGGLAPVRLGGESGESADGHGPGFEPSGSTTPSRLAVHREQAAAMLEALAGVPPEWRDVVRLRLFHQMTLNQVGEQLGISLAVVRTSLRRGSEVYRQRLRAAGIGRSTLGSVSPRAERAGESASGE